MIPNHLLDTLVLKVLLLLLHLNDMLLLSLILFKFLSFHSNFVIMIVLASLYVVSHLLLHGMISLNESLFFHGFLFPSFFSLSCQFFVSLSL